VQFIMMLLFRLDCCRCQVSKWDIRLPLSRIHFYTIIGFFFIDDTLRYWFIRHSSYLLRLRNISVSLLSRFRDLWGILKYSLKILEYSLRIQSVINFELEIMFQYQSTCRNLELNIHDMLHRFWRSIDGFWFWWHISLLAG